MTCAYFACTKSVDASSRAPKSRTMSTGRGASFLTTGAAVALT